MRRRSATSLSKSYVDYDTFVEKSFFNVNEVDGFYMDLYGNMIKTPDKKVLVRDDGSYISTVGKNYSIVDNKHYFDGVISALTQSEIDYTPKQVHVECNGKRTIMVVELPQFDLFPNTKETQKAELRIINSFDATLAADTILGFLRLICTNGMTAFDQQFRYKMVHKGDILLKAEQAIELYKNFENVWCMTKEQINKMGNSYGRKDAVAKYIGDGEVSLNSLFKGERWAKKLQEKWQQENEPVNLWDIYNIFTNILSHEYGHNYSSKLAKMEELNRESRKWNNIFEVSSTIPVIEEAYYEISY